MTEPTQSIPPPDPHPLRTSLLARGTTDLMVLMVAFTICASVVIGGSAIIVMGLLRPEADNTRGLAIIADILNTLIGLLAGFLAGRTDAKINIAKQQEEAQTQTGPPTQTQVGQQ